MNSFELSVRFFLQMAFILGVCRVVGWGFRRLGQSQVVSEMIAGVLMGPSLMGWLFPSFSDYLFPKASQPIIFSAAQIGLVLYMFLIGVEFNVAMIRSRMRSAASVSLAGILVPFSLGSLLALSFAKDPAMFSAGVTTSQAVLFLGASMSITAFPMLARIILEQGLANTPLGTLALAAGSMDDAAAWAVLAIVLASFSGDAGIAVKAIGGGALYVLATLLLVKPLLAGLGRKVESEGRMSLDVLTLVLMLVMAAAWLTDTIRLYAVFGAFVMGIAMPRGLFARELYRILFPLTTAFLLPVFFVYSGLNTRIGLVTSPAMLGAAALIFLAATAGKGGACYLAARLHGEPHREAMAIGTLMNARGLMELIIVNIGLERGLIQPALFAILVMMAIATTLMATPIFERVYGKQEARDNVPAPPGPVPA